MKNKEFVIDSQTSLKWDGSAFCIQQYRRMPIELTEEDSRELIDFIKSIDQEIAK